MVEFYPSVNNFTLALLVTNIASDGGWAALAAEEDWNNIQSLLFIQ